MSGDLVDRLKESASQARAIDRKPLLEEAAGEIESLRARLADAQQAWLNSKDYAYRVGFFQGTLEVIRDFRVDAKAVAREALNRFPG